MSTRRGCIAVLAGMAVVVVGFWSLITWAVIAWLP